MPRRLELWGGVECTVNRVRDRYHCQLTSAGHADRVDDLDRFAALGMRTLRYPLLWERIAPHGPHSADWSWPDQRMQRMNSLGITPIVGLVHHGSGPRCTHLLDPRFPDLLAEYALSVARRYPWIEYYTPVNEALTTARFSALYGLWYPHAASARDFLTALILQCRGIVLAMRAVRLVNSDAKLVQTDDLGRTYATGTVSYQADFQNELRWLAWDLLCGKVASEHPLWSWMVDACEVPEGSLHWFQDHPCPPAMLGINHYVTSDRLLDHRLDLYPAHTHGGNGRDRYADVEAVRALTEPPSGIVPLLIETWQRYGLPLAITEAHLAGQREDQMRWLTQIWQAARKAQDDGIDIRAVTAWALLGAHDWDSLVTEWRGHYESGAFDVRSDPPRPTALAKLCRELATDQQPSHPAAHGRGWWQRPGRLLRSLAALDAVAPDHRAEESHGGCPILIIDGNGTLGSAFVRLCAARELDFTVASCDELDLADDATMDRLLAQHEPWAVINAAGYDHVDNAERQPEQCYRQNAIAPSLLARLCARNGIQLMTFSSDLVFDGRADSPYVESARVAPLSVYGRSKLDGENGVLDSHPDALVVRTCSYFGPWDQDNFIASVLRSLARGTRYFIAKDVTVSPTYVPDLVDACLDLVIDAASGIWHINNSGAITWGELAKNAAARAGLDASRLDFRAGREAALLAPRPHYSALTSERAVLLPPIADAIDRYFGHPERLRHESRSRS